MNEDRQKFLTSLYYPATFVLFLWIIKLVETMFNLSLAGYGLLPRQAKGLIGIITTPLLHADFNHLISNSLPLIFLGTGLFYFYKEASIKTALIIYFAPSMIVWIFGRDAYHIGASGLIYGLVTFMFFSGIIRRDARSIALSLVVTFLYGSLVWGVLPLDAKVSWESHLAGAFVGFICALLFKKLDVYKRYDW
ncbi:MAG: rhomboid family intramembrane serine protease, partial [Ignavibacteriaceae bacterium]|nr:rhomboid family intramembrane serine protease [Ignavibacteriaceae bacterium]